MAPTLQRHNHLTDRTLTDIRFTNTASTARREGNEEEIRRSARPSLFVGVTVKLGRGNPALGITNVSDSPLCDPPASRMLITMQANLGRAYSTHQKHPAFSPHHLAFSPILTALDQAHVSREHCTITALKANLFRVEVMSSTNPVRILLEAAQPHSTEIVTSQWELAKGESADVPIGSLVHSFLVVFLLRSPPVRMLSLGVP